MVIALTIIVTSMIGGVIAAYLLDIPLFKALAMSSDSAGILSQAF